MIDKRNISIQLYGSVIPYVVYINGMPVAYYAHIANHKWNYSGADLSLHIRADEIDCNVKTTAIVHYPTYQVDGSGMSGKMNRIKNVVSLLKNSWFGGAPLPDVVSATNQVPLHIEYNPANFNQYVNNLFNNYKKVEEAIGNILSDKKLSISEGTTLTTN